MIYNLCSILVALCLIATPILLVVFIAKAIRHTPKKIVGFTAVSCAIGIFLFSIIGGIGMTDEQRVEREQKQTESGIIEKTELSEEDTKEPIANTSELDNLSEEVSEEVKEFAADNCISIALAESVENALSESEVPSSLKALKDWKQTEDYAYGQRYTVWSYSVVTERYYYMIFYVKDDVVESIRDQQNGLEVLYNRE